MCQIFTEFRDSDVQDFAIAEIKGLLIAFVVKVAWDILSFVSSFISSKLNVIWTDFR